METPEKEQNKLIHLGKIFLSARCYPAMLLFEVFRSKDVPTTKKSLILCALAYIIFPIDFLPDFILGLGFVDDMAATMVMVRTILGSITPELSGTVKERLHRFFGDFDERVLDFVDKLLHIGHKVINKVNTPDGKITKISKIFSSEKAIEK